MNVNLFDIETYDIWLEAAKAPLYKYLVTERKQLPFDDMK